MRTVAPPAVPTDLSLRATLSWERAGPPAVDFFGLHGASDRSETCVDIEKSGGFIAAYKKCKDLAELGPFLSSAAVGQRKC